MRTEILEPILPGDYPDPSILRVGSEYYLTFSSLQYRPCLTLLRSADLIHWDFVTHCFNDFDYDIWAPDLVEVKGRFYIYFYAGQENWVTWADHIEGPWSQPLPLDIPDYIDPGHAVDDQGQRYLFLGRGMRVKLSDDGLQRISEPEMVFPVYQIDSREDIEGDFMEGPKLCRRGDWFYYTFATGGTAGPATGHRVVSARSRSLDGPWEFSPYDPVLQCRSRSEPWHCKGHGTLIDDPEGNAYLVYHAYRKDRQLWGRQILIERVSFDENDWFYVDSAHPITTAALPQTIQFDFSNGIPWTLRSFRNHDLTRFEAASNTLRMQGRGWTLGESEPLLMTVNEDDFQIDVHVKLQGEVSAGLCCFYNPEHCAGILADAQGVSIIRHNRVLARQEGTGEHLWLRMELKQLYLRFYVSQDGRDYKKINNVIDISGYNHNNYDGFLSVKPGFSVIGKGQAELSDLTYRTQARRKQK